MELFSLTARIVCFGDQPALVNNLKYKFSLFMRQIHHFETKIHVQICWHYLDSLCNNTQLCWVDWLMVINLLGMEDFRLKQNFKLQ